MKIERWLCGVAVLFLTDFALAAEPESAAEESPAATDAAAEPAPAPATDQVGDSKAAFQGDDVKDALVAGSPVEEPGKTYYFVGLRYRGIVVPKFEMNLFGDGGRSLYVNGLGPEFAIRRDNFEYELGLWWAGYSMPDTPFKASNDPALAWEVVSSEINVINLTADFMWSAPVSPEFAINYGAGIGLGIVFGNLYRTQAYPAGGNIADLDSLEKCFSVGAPDPIYCDTENDHYNGYTEGSWANGGSKPIVFPWLSGQFGFRYKPHRNFALRGDVGIGLTGFFFGVAADYGI